MTTAVTGRNHRAGALFAVWGILLQLGMVAGLAVTIFAMIQAFSHMASQPGTSPDSMASTISLGLYATAAGLVLALIGAVFLFIALIGMKYHEAWFRSAMWVISILWLFSFPVGTILGVVVIIYLVKNRSENTGFSTTGSCAHSKGSASSRA